MGVRMRKWALLSAIGLMTVPVSADAFGLRTHLYIADQLLEDINRSEGGCNVQVVGREVEIDRNVCRAIKNHPKYFRAGAIGPDAFPDLVVGQSFVHPGTENGRQTSDWLSHMLANAKTDEELAFAFGNVVHAAGDIFAHSYVNNYAGGVFDLAADRSKNVELRHTLLEKYIDQRLDYDPRPDQLAVPAAFLVRTMVRTNYVPLKVGADDIDLVALFENPASEIASMMGNRIRAGAPGSHMMVMWGMLALAEREERLAPCKYVDTVDDSTQALLAYITAEYRARAADAERRGIEVPVSPDLSRFVKIDTPCETPAAEAFAGYPDTPERELPAASAIARAKATYEELLTVAGLENEDFATNRRDQWWRELGRNERRELTRSFEAFVSSIEAQNKQHALTVFTDYWAEDMRGAIEAYMQASLATARQMIDSSAPYPQTHLEGEGGSTHYSRWFECYRQVFEGQPIQVASAECERRAELGMAMSLSQAAREAGIGQFNRNLYYRILSFGRWMDRQMTEALFGLGKLVSPTMTHLIETLIEPERVGRDKLDKTFSRNDSHQVRFRCVSDWIDADLGLIPRWQGEGFRPDNDCAMQNDVTYLVRSSEWFSPDQFVPLSHAITLAKVALLDQSGVKTLAIEVAGSSENGAEAPTADALVKELQLSEDVPYSILLDTARSLDGSYQWNGLSMPYPRQDGYRRGGVPLISAGHPECSKCELGNDSLRSIRGRPGFPYYRTENLRRFVFSAIFPEPFEGEILKAEQFGDQAYPFAPCEFDPFRPDREGNSFTRVCKTRRTD